MTPEREPLVIRASIVAVVTAIVHLAVVLGWLHIAPDQEAAVSGVVDLIGTAVVVIWSRGGVTPTADPRTDDGTPLVPAATPPVG